MTNKLSISFVIPCFNESLNIVNTVKQILLSVEKLNINLYEIIIIDDGSTDDTYLKIQNIQKKFQNIKLIRNTQNLGYGGAVKKGFELANKKYVMWIPGDNSHQGNEIKKIIANINNYDFVTTYYTNVKKRNFFRRWFTRLYTPFLNFIFRLDLPYYNGLTVYKTVLLQNLKINTDSFTFQIEIFVNLIKKYKCNYTFVPTLLSDRDEGSSKAFKIKNVFMVLKSIMLIFFNIYFNKF